MASVDVFKSISNRYQAIDQSIRKGNLKLTRAIQNYVWLVGKDKLGIARAGSAEPQQANDADYSIPFVISVLEEDRDGDIVMPSGCRLHNYAKNPVVFFGHQENPIPIATSRNPYKGINSNQISITVDNDRLRAIAYFDRLDPDADFIYGKVKRGFLNATSIAFVPLEAHRRDTEEKARTHSGSMQMPLGWVFRSYDLTEWSIVGVPSNAGAIRDSLDTEKSFISSPLQKALKPYCAVAKNCWNGWCLVPDVAAKTVPTTKKSCSCSSCKPGGSCSCSRLPKFPSSPITARQLVNHLGSKNPTKPDIDDSKSLNSLSGTAGGYTIPPNGKRRKRPKKEISMATKATKRKPVKVETPTELKEEYAKTLDTEEKQLSESDIQVESTDSTKLATEKVVDSPTIVEKAKKPFKPKDDDEDEDDTDDKEDSDEEADTESDTAASEESKGPDSEDDDDEEDASEPDESATEEEEYDDNEAEDATVDSDVEGDGTEDEDSDVEPVNSDEPFVTKASAQVLASLYSHLKSASDYLNDELRTMDNPGVAASINPAFIEHINAGMAMLQDCMAEHHPDHNLDKMCKAMETDSASSDDDYTQGEARSVAEGDIPPGDEESKEEVLVDDPDQDDGDDEFDGTIDEDRRNEEILERYRHSKTGKILTRKYLVQYEEDGTKYLVRVEDTPVITPTTPVTPTKAVTPVATPTKAKEVKKPKVTTVTIPSSEQDPSLNKTVSDRWEAFERRLGQLTGIKLGVGD